MTDRRESHPTVGTAYPPRNTWDGAVMYFVVLASILAILGVLLFVAPKAFAQDPDGRWVRQAVRSSCDWWENCPRHRWKYIRRYQPRHIEIRNVYREREDRYDAQCREFVVAVGEERYGRDRAKEAAEAIWMEATRARFGTKWMDLRNARGGTWECGRSSTGNRASEKAQDLVGKFLEQCELKARPCRAELERVNKE
jgi:hypothetical protein